MAKYQAIATTSNAVHLMLENAALDSEWSDANVELFQAANLQNPSSATKPRVFGPRIRPDRRTHQPSLPVDLHYLITAWSQDAPTARERVLSLDDPTTLMSQHNIIAASEAAENLAKPRRRG